jgi:hypothetical protein
MCAETTIHCLEKGGKHAERSHITLMLDCADICRTSADFMIRNSDFHDLTCEACAEICVRCAEDCEHFPEDRQMENCAQMCRACAESCHLMAAAG